MKTPPWVTVLTILGVTIASGVFTSSLHAMPPANAHDSLTQWLADQPGGVAAAYVDRDGVAFLNAGRYSASDATPVTEDTEFEIGSITKLFTALLLADSVGAGKVNFETKVGLPFTDTTITYLQLATHTSGLPRLPKDFAPADAQNPYVKQNLAALVNSFNSESPRAKPTAQSNYSNFGFSVLGQSLAHVWAESYEAVLKQRVLIPLGLRDTATSWREVKAERLAPGNLEREGVAHWDSNAYAPAGALVSTTRDLGRFVQACLGFVDTPLADAIAETLRPRAAGDAPMRRVGLGWILEQNASGGTTLIWHNGGTGGFRSVVILDPARRAGVVVLTNHARGVEALGKSLLEGTAVAAPKPADPALQEYVGKYPLAPSFVIAITAAGNALFAQATNQGRLTLRSTGADNYGIEGVDASISFQRDAGGKIVALILHQNGRDQRAEKLAN